MAIKINDVLNAVKAKLAELPDLTAQQIHLGPIEPTIAQHSAHVVIVELDEPGERTDGGKIRRRLKLEIAVVMRIDPVKGDADIQINEVYQPIHAQLEQLRDGLTGVFLTMQEDELGPQSQTVWDTVALRIKSCSWVVTFDRTLAQTQ